MSVAEDFAKNHHQLTKLKKKWRSQKEQLLPLLDGKDSIIVDNFKIECKERTSLATITPKMLNECVDLYSQSGIDNWDPETLNAFIAFVVKYRKDSKKVSKHIVISKC